PPADRRSFEACPASVRPTALNALVDKPLAPPPDGRLRHPQLLGDRGVVQAGRARQDNACSPRQQRRGPRPVRPRLKRLPLLLSHDQSRLRSSHNLPPVSLYDERPIVIYVTSGTRH